MGIGVQSLTDFYTVSFASMSPGDGSASMAIPIVDFTSWKNTHDQASRLRTAQELVKACQTVGFVYIINHSLPESVLDEAFDWMKRLFILPEEEKMKAPHPEGWAVHRGYSWPGLEKVSQAMPTGNDEEAKKRLREIPDVKVCCGLPRISTKVMHWNNIKSTRPLSYSATGSI